MDCSKPDFPVYHRLPGLARTHVYRVSDVIQPSHPLSYPSPPSFNLSHHQGLFQWVSFSHQVAKLLELQLQHQSFQWIFRIDFLYNWLVLSPWSPRHLAAPQHVGSFWIRDQIHSSCIGRQTVYHWATRESPYSWFLITLALWLERVLDMNSFFLLLSLVLWPSMWSTLENVPCALTKNVYPAAYR